MSKGMSGHQRAYRGKSDTWLTPPSLIEKLGPFDLDPCCPEDMPWTTANKMLTPADDGLTTEWRGRVWLNPPYGPETELWLKKMAEHANGIALIFARTETKAWHEHVWPHCDSVTFLRGRLHFHDANGTRAAFNSGAPSALVAYTAKDTYQIQESDISGTIVVPY